VTAPAHEPERRLLVTERDPEIAGDRAGEEARVLDRDRPVEAERLAQRHQLVDRGVARQHGRRGIARQS